VLCVAEVLVKGDLVNDLLYEGFFWDGFLGVVSRD
jgi:hypothetical protein